MNGTFQLDLLNVNEILNFIHGINLRMVPLRKNDVVESFRAILRVSCMHIECLWVGSHQHHRQNLKAVSKNCSLYYLILKLLFVATRWPYSLFANYSIEYTLVFCEKRQNLALMMRNKFKGTKRKVHRKQQQLQEKIKRNELDFWSSC